MPSAASPTPASTRSDGFRSRLMTVLHLMVLGAAVALVAYITYDTMINVSFITNPRYLKMEC